MGSGCTANRAQNTIQSIERAGTSKQTTDEQKLQVTPLNTNPEVKEEAKESVAPDIETNMEPLHPSDIWKAIDENDIPKLKRALTTSDLAPGDLFNSKGQSILHVAASLGNCGAISAIMECNIATMTIDILNAKLASPLHLAIIQDKIDAVKLLISYGADANIEDENGQTPILLCCIHGRKAIAELLIDSNTNGKLPEPLNINAKDRKGLCALNCSAIKGDLEFCKLLIEKGKANVDEPSHKNCTALVYAARGGYDQIVELLLASKANKVHQDAAGSMALHHACEKNFHVVVEKLLKAGTDGNIQDLAGRTPLFEAVLNNSVDSLNVLLDNKVNVNAIDFLGHTATFYAARDGNIELVKLLIEKGDSDINLYSMPNQDMEKEALEKKEESGLSRLQVHAINTSRVPLHAAAASGHAELVEYLLSKGARLAEPGRHNNDSLHIACYAGNILAAKVLIKAGIDPTIKNSRSLSAIDLISKYYPAYTQDLLDLMQERPKQEIKVYEGEKEEEPEKEELSMIEGIENKLDDPRLNAIGKVYGEKVLMAVQVNEKRYKGFKWLLKNYFNIGITPEAVKVLLGGISFALEERIHKMNLIALELLESIIVSSAPLLSNKVLEEFALVDLLFNRATNTTDRLLNRILDVLPKLGDIPGVGVEYLITKCMSNLQTALNPESEEAKTSKNQKVVNVILQIILKLIDSFGPDNWPSKELEEILGGVSAAHNKLLRTNIQQILTIMKESKSERGIVQEVTKEDSTPTKKILEGAEEHAIELQKGVEALSEKSEGSEWEEKYKQLIEILSEKNLVNFLAGVDAAEIFITKCLVLKRDFLETHLIELLQPILLKIDSSNKRIKKKCRDVVLSFWKSSIAKKDWLHIHLATFLTSPDQHKLFAGAMTLFGEIMNYIQELKIVEQKVAEDSLGVEIEKLIKMASMETANKMPLIRQISMDIIIKSSEIIGNLTGSKEKFILAYDTLLKTVKPAIKDKIMEKLHAEVSEGVKKRAEDKAASPEKIPAEEDKAALIYAEPLNEEVKKQILPALQYFSEQIMQCIHSWNWVSRYNALNKIREELTYATLGELSGDTVDCSKRHVNIVGASISKSTDAWLILLKHILEDPVLKIYIEGIDLLKEVFIIFKKYIPAKEEIMKIVDPLINIVQDKLNDQKPKIREKSIDFLQSLLKEELILPEYLSEKIMHKFEEAKGNLSVNQFGSTLRIVIECVSTYKLTANNQKTLSAYMQLLNTCLKHQLPSVRQSAEELYVALHTLHGDTINNYLVNLKGTVVKKLQSLVKKDKPSEGPPSIPPGGKGASTSSGITALRNLVEAGTDSLLNSELPAQRIKGLVGIKKYLSKQLSTKEISAEKAHEMLEELSMLMRTILNDTNPEVYVEVLNLLKYALNQLLKRLTPFDLQITVNTIISILIPKTISSAHHKIQIASDKFIISLGKESLVGPIVIMKNIFRLIDKAASEYVGYFKAMRMSSSQHGFNKPGAGGSSFDANQNIATVARYLGVTNIVLGHYKTTIAHSKEAIEIFGETAVNLWTVYNDKAQIKESLGHIAREIRSIDIKAFDILLSKKEGEARTKLNEIIKESTGENEEAAANAAMMSAKKKMGSSKGFAGSNPSSSILPSVYPASNSVIVQNKTLEEQKMSKGLPSYAKRIGKGAGSNTSSKQVLPPIANPEKPSSLPPLVVRKNPGDPKRESLSKPIWLNKEDQQEDKHFFNTKTDFDKKKSGDFEEENDDPIKSKAFMSHPFKFPK